MKANKQVFGKINGVRSLTMYQLFDDYKLDLAVLQKCDFVAFYSEIY